MPVMHTGTVSEDVLKFPNSTFIFYGVGWPGVAGY